MSCVPPAGVWLFDRRTDLWTFGGSAVLSLVALGVGVQQGWLDDDLSPAVFVLTIVLVDVAHVWSTVFRTYLDPVERARRPLLYVFTPVFAYIGGVALYQTGDLNFWRAFAYLAVFHFVRQQYGFVSLCRARAGETGGALLDALAIYSATLYPLIYWHGHLPRGFDWFVAGDFVSIPAVIETVAAPFYWAVLGAYTSRSVWRFVRHRRLDPGKDLIVATTVICWYTGIVAFDSDYAFTVTNVFLHGIPYLVLIHRTSRPFPKASKTPRAAKAAFLPYLGVVWVLAYGEELAWDRAVWHEHATLFGSGWQVAAALPYLVPLLAVPQLTHYILDGFIWRRPQKDVATNGGIRFTARP